jgi:hypothetical protein
MYCKKLTLRVFTVAALFGAGAFTQTSCSSLHTQETTTARDRAYNEFSAFVAQTEASASAAATQAAVDYERATAQLKSDYDTRMANVERYYDQYDDTRRQEIEALGVRYAKAYERRAAARSTATKLSR